MKYRVWFNTGTTDLKQSWVVASEVGQSLASKVVIYAVATLKTDFQSCPKGWIECEGEFHFRLDADGGLTVAVIQ